MKIKFAILSLGFVFLPFTSFAVDNMHWAPRMFAAGASASLGDLMEVATAVDHKDRPVYGSYYYYNYDSHSEKNVYITGNDVSSTGGDVAYDGVQSDAAKPKIQDGGRVSWEWEFK